MKWLINIVILIFILIFILAMLLHLGKIKRYKKRKIAYDDIFENMINLQGKKCAAIEFTKRCGIYYKTYFFYQFLSKGINILSMTFTVLSMVMTSYSQDVSLVSSMLALICVILMIYLNPGKRAEQYLCAWRLCDTQIYSIICSIDAPRDVLYKKIDEIPEIIKQAEELLTLDME